MSSDGFRGSGWPLTGEQLRVAQTSVLTTPRPKEIQR
jgi:hypothetical protein